MRKLIVDLGMHDGTDTKFYLLKGFDVIGVEASPKLCADVREKYSKYIESGRLIVEECAVYSENKDIEFDLDPQHSDWGSLNRLWNHKYSTFVEPIVVKGRTLFSILSKYRKPYFIKIDLEGYDLECVKQLYNCELPEYISVELLTYNNISQFQSSSEIFFHLNELGYTKFQLVDQSLNYKIKCPIPPLEGGFVDFKFNGFSSGLFGEELPNNWTSMDYALKQYLNYFYNQTHPNSWWDLHCVK